MTNLLQGAISPIGGNNASFPMMPAITPLAQAAFPGAAQMRAPGADSSAMGWEALSTMGIPGGITTGGASQANVTMMQQLLDSCGKMQMLQMCQTLQKMIELMMQLMGKGDNGADSGASTAAAGGGSAGASTGGSAGASGAAAANPSQQIDSAGANPGKAQIEKLLEQAAAKYGIPPDVLKAVAWKESNWNPSSTGDGGKSHGIMQIYSTAHPDYDVAKGKADVAYNIEYGAKFLAELYKKYGNWQEAAVHYNGSGPAAVAYGASVMSLSQQKPWG